MRPTLRPWLQNSEGTPSLQQPQPRHRYLFTRWAWGRRWDCSVGLLSSLYTIAQSISVVTPYKVAFRQLCWRAALSTWKLLAFICTFFSGVVHSSPTVNKYPHCLMQAGDPVLTYFPKWSAVSLLRQPAEVGAGGLCAESNPAGESRPETAAFCPI